MAKKDQVEVDETKIRCTCKCGAVFYINFWENTPGHDAEIASCPNCTKERNSRQEVDIEYYDPALKMKAEGASIPSSYVDEEYLVRNSG